MGMQRLTNEIEIAAKFHTSHLGGGSGEQCEEFKVFRFWPTFRPEYSSVNRIGLGALLQSVSTFW